MKTTNFRSRYQRAVNAAGSNSEFEDRAKHFAAPTLAKYFSEGTDAKFLLELTSAAQPRADAMTGVFDSPSNHEVQAVSFACLSEKRIKSVLNWGGFVAAVGFCLLCGLLFGSQGFLLSILGPSVLAFLIGVGFTGIFIRRSDAYEQAIIIAARTLAFERQKEEYWKGLTWRELEIKVASIFTRQGYKAKATPGSGDKGVDVIAISGSEKIIIQCKQYNKPAQPSVVRELLGTKVSQEADRAILICTGGFAPGAVSAALENGIELWNLQDLVEEAQKSNTLEPSTPSPVREKRSQEPIQHSIPESKNELIIIPGAQLPLMARQEQNEPNPRNNTLQTERSARTKCAMEFATWFTCLPDFDYLEDRREIVNDLDRIEENMNSNGKWVGSLPSLLFDKERQMGTRDLADWTEEVMEKLEMPAPDSWTDQTIPPAEKVSNLVEVLVIASRDGLYETT